MTPFDALGNKPFENTVGKGEIAHDEENFVLKLLDEVIAFCVSLLRGPVQAIHITG